MSDLHGHTSWAAYVAEEYTIGVTHDGKDWPERVEQEILSALATARASALEEAMKAMCMSCRKGVSLVLGSPYDRREPKVWCHTEPFVHDCGADKIRRSLTPAQAADKDKARDGDGGANAH